MIITIRKQFKTKILQSILIFFMGIFFIFFILPDLSQRLLMPSAWLIKVNNREIEQQDFARVFTKHKENIQFIREQYGPYATMFLNMLGLSGDLNKVVLDELIRTELLNIVAKDIPLYVQEQYLEQCLNNVQLAQRSGITNTVPLGCWGQYGLDQKCLHAYLTHNHIHMKQFESLAQQAIMHQIVSQLAEIGAYQPKFMVNQEVERDLSLRRYAILTLSLEKIKQEEHAKAINQDALASFFAAENKASKRYWIPEQRSGRVWTFDPAEYGISIAESDLEAYYKKYCLSKYIKEPAKVQVRRILIAKSDQEAPHQSAQRAVSLHNELVKDPSLFESYARQYSQDKDSASQGGLLPLFAKGEQKDAVLEKKAFLLNSDGQISDVFESSQGYEILQRVHKKPAVCKEFCEVKKDILDTLLRQEFSQQFNSDIKHRIVSKTIHEDVMQKFAQEKKAHLTKIALSAKDGSKLMQGLFKLKKGAVDFYIDEGKGYVVLLDEIKRTHEPSLETVKSQVRDDYIAVQADCLLKEQVNAIEKELLHESPQNIARKFGAELYETDFINPGHEKAQGLRDKQIPLESMFQIVNKGSVGGHIQHNGYIFKVMEVKATAPEEFLKKKQELLSSIYQQISALFTQGFVASLARNAKIEFSELLSAHQENK